MARSAHAEASSRYFLFARTLGHFATSLPQIGIKVVMDLDPRRRKDRERLLQNVPLEDVQYLLGHSDARVTRLYVRGQRRVTRNTVERISVYLRRTHCFVDS